MSLKLSTEELMGLLAAVDRIDHTLFLTFSLVVLAELSQEDMAAFARKLRARRIEIGTQSNPV